MSKSLKEPQAAADSEDLAMKLSSAVQNAFGKSCPNMTEIREFASSLKDALADGGITMTLTEDAHQASVTLFSEPADHEFQILFLSELSPLSPGRICFNGMTPWYQARFDWSERQTRLIKVLGEWIANTCPEPVIKCLYPGRERETLQLDLTNILPFVPKDRSPGL